ncbi:hypothetical protein OG417_03905 [Actinoallomurus sp. NBC_01490]|uniref:hypothetical protein n=1 Tax=Actinoallomurus sp. NBC_01490 TaxID=2903557 RepID=UPI002E30DC98|nr:hypothetical protein [Actinoallomurus sp. NBC_01490]
MALPPALARRIAAHSAAPARREHITFNDSTGEVCDASCRRTARLDRTTALAAGLGYRI